MDLQSLIFTQIAIEIALFIAILIVLVRVKANVKKTPSDSQQQMAAEIKKMITESQRTADVFLRSLEEGMNAMKEIALRLEQKEKNLKNLLEQAEQGIERLKNENAGNDNSFSQSKYAEVVNMIKKGFSEEETAKITGFTQAEIGLIVDLSRIKNEKS